MDQYTCRNAFVEFNNTNIRNLPNVSLDCTIAYQTKQSLHFFSLEYKGHKLFTNVSYSDHYTAVRYGIYIYIFMYIYIQKNAVSSLSDRSSIHFVVPNHVDQLFSVFFQFGPLVKISLLYLLS